MTRIELRPLICRLAGALLVMAQLVGELAGQTDPYGPPRPLASSGGVRRLPRISAPSEVHPVSWPEAPFPGGAPMSRQANLLQPIDKRLQQVGAESPFVESQEPMNPAAVSVETNESTGTPDTAAPHFLPIESGPFQATEYWISRELQEAHVFQVGDQVEITFPFRPSFNQLLAVRDDGVVTPTLAPPIMAAGKTPEMLQAELSAFYQSISYNAALNRKNAATREYRLQVGDEIEVRFSVASEQSQRVTVRPDGRITLTRIGDVIAEGKSPEDLRQSLIGRYKLLIPHPELVVVVHKYTDNLLYVDGRPTQVGLTGIDQLTVRIIRLAPRLVYVTGEVGHPSAISYLPGMTAHRAIVTAGGFKRSGAMHRVVILRRVSPIESHELLVNLQPPTLANKLLWRDGGYLDIPLKQDDVVVIPKTTVAKVQDFLDEYVYNLFPVTRNSQFALFYDLRGPQNFNPGAAVP